MAEREVLVYLEFGGAPQLVGRLWGHLRGGRESATFAYDHAWLRHPARFSLEPALMLGPGAFHTEPGRLLFGSIGDSAPDRWGRLLMRQAERQRARSDGEQPRTLHELDYLLRVYDEARQGALRFAETEGGPFQAASGRPVPPMVALPQLLVAADHIATDGGTDDEVRMLLAPGSSLGGARPKASVRLPTGELAIAKFPQPADDYDVVAWEAVALALADRARVPVPEWRLDRVAGRRVLISRRFDRAAGTGRVPFLSAMSMLGARDNQTRSYLELVDAIHLYGAAPSLDSQGLWRRIVLYVLISNTDDHLRNLGFLYSGTDGWRLSPAYDLNPVPTDLKPRVLSTAIDFDETVASLPLALEVADYFGLKPAAARQIAGEVGRAVASWREEAARLDLTNREIERMASAFEHDDLRLAAGSG